MFFSVVLLACDCYDSWLYSQNYQMYMMFKPTKIPSTVVYQGMVRDWLAFCFIGSISLFFGTLWLYKELILVGSAINLVFLPPWTVAVLYLTYNSSYNGVLIPTKAGDKATA